jgi:hypothetical protein
MASDKGSQSWRSLIGAHCMGAIANLVIVSLLENALNMKSRSSARASETDLLGDFTSISYRAKGRGLGSRLSSSIVFSGMYFPFKKIFFVDKIHSYDCVSN